MPAAPGVNRGAATGAACLTASDGTAPADVADPASRASAAVAETGSTPRRSNRRRGEVDVGTVRCTSSSSGARRRGPHPDGAPAQAPRGYRLGADRTAAFTPYPGLAMDSTTRTYDVRTFGCQMNVHDSERLTGLLE